MKLNWVYGKKQIWYILLIWWLVCLISQGRSFWTVIATIVKHQWFSGSPLPLNEWFGRNHWYQWFFNGFRSINHWSWWFFRLATIGLDGFAMVFGLATIGLNGFSMVANHWSNYGMVTIHRRGLLGTLRDHGAFHPRLLHVWGGKTRIIHKHRWITHQKNRQVQPAGSGNSPAFRWTCPWQWEVSAQQTTLQALPKLPDQD